MHHHARRLVDHDDVVVLVQDRDVERLGLRRRIDRLGRVDLDRLPGLHRLIRLRLLSVHADVPVLDQPLDLGARLAGQHRDEKAIEADALAVVGDRDGVTGHQATVSAYATFFARFGSG